jgi:hypothetical protein
MRNQNSHNQQQNPDGQAENNEELSAIGANVLALLPHSIPPAARSSEASVATNSNGAGSESSIQRVSREDTRLPPHHLGWPPSVQMAGLIECENRMFAGTLKQYFEGAQPNPVAAATKGKEQAHAPTACGSSNALDKLARAGEFNILDMNLTFPVKLHMLLSYPACRDYLRWSSHGRAWIITKPKEFEAHVLPKFFRSVKMASFMRQVSLLSVSGYFRSVPLVKLCLTVREYFRHCFLHRSTGGPFRGSLKVLITTPTGTLSFFGDCRILLAR